MRIFDTHAHYSHQRFNLTRDDILAQWIPNPVINPAIRYEDNWLMRERLDRWENVYYAAGIHPAQIPPDEGQDDHREEWIRKFANEKRTAAVGETGLDYHHSAASKERQELWFRRQIEIAQDYELPLILHIRDAHEDAVKILSEYQFGKNPGVVHCFHGTPAQAEEFLDMGFLLGIGGVLTHDGQEEFREAVRRIPLEKMILETDAPFLRPVGWEGCNNSFSIPLIIRKIAELKGERDENIAEITYRTACRIFGIDMIGHVKKNL